MIIYQGKRGSECAIRPRSHDLDGVNAPTSIPFVVAAPGRRLGSCCCGDEVQCSQVLSTQEVLASFETRSPTSTSSWLMIGNPSAPIVIEG